MLNDLKRLCKPRKVRGRGGSRGGTSGRGHKGHSARSGGVTRAGFEGGQMPYVRRLPQRGFSNKRFQKEVVIVSLADIAQRFDDGATIGVEELVKSGLLKSSAKLVKVLGGADIDKKLIITVDLFSVSAEKEIKTKGGQAVRRQENLGSGDTKES